MTPCYSKATRGNIGHMRIFLHKNGRWYLQIDHDHKKSLGKISKAEAQAALKFAEKEARRGAALFQLPKGERITLSEWKDEYLSGRGHLSPKTLEKDELSLRLLGEAIGGNILLRSITKQRLDEFIGVCFARGNSKASVNSYLRHIRAALNSAYEVEYLEKPVRVKMIREPQPLPQVLSPEQLRAVLEKAHERSPLLGRMLTFAVWTGCRRGEIINLRWENVRADMARITGKGQKERLVPLTPQALAALGPRQDIGLVFPKPASTTYMEQFLTRGLKDIIRELGLPDQFHLHSLRHSAATHMLASGLPISTVQKILGHSNIGTTQIYAKVLEDTLREQIKGFKI